MDLMNLEHFRLKLLEKQRECQKALAAFEAEGRVAGNRGACGREIDPALLEARLRAARCVEDPEAQDKPTPRLPAGASL